MQNRLKSIFSVVENSIYVFIEYTSILMMIDKKTWTTMWTSLSRPSTDRTAGTI